MKKLFLLVIILATLSGYSQTDSLLRAQRIQDSIRDQELLEILKPLEQGPTIPVEPPKTQIKDSVNLPPVVPVIKDTMKKELPSQPVIDTAKSKVPVEQPPAQISDTTKLNTTVPENKSVTDTVNTKLKPVATDSIKTQPFPADTSKPKPVLDSIIPPVLPPPDTLKPAPAVTQTIDPSSLKGIPVDSLNPDQLLVYYQNEPEPPSFYKGPDVGDSVYYVLNPLTIPTNTVEGVSLRHEEGSGQILEMEEDTSAGGQKFKPKISLGAGRMGFNGDLYSKHFQTLSMGRPGFDLAISHRMTSYLQVDFSVLFGTLGANERLNNRNENFKSEIRAGGVNFIYDFGNFIPTTYKVKPFVSLGAYGFEFLSKTDLKDKNGNTYYYWSDGSIKNIPQNAPGAQNAVDLKRDYVYESDIRELNRDGFGKYQERAFAFPLGVGFIMKVTNRVDLKFNFQYYFSTTDYIDGISNKSVGDRIGTKRKDGWTYTSFALQYDLIAKKPTRNSRFIDTLSRAYWLALDNEDEDEDGVNDMQDDCLGTAKGAKVDLKGCPIDEDNDGIPNYRDDELATAPGTPVNARGVGQTDAYWQKWYDDYMNDSTSTDRITENVGNIYAVAPVKKPKQNKDNFTVELVRYAGPIPSDELAFLLSIGDINSVTLDDGTTVVYTSGTYDKLSTAIKRRDEFRTTGTKSAGISRIQGKEIIQVGDEELQKLLASEIEDLMNVKVDSTASDSIDLASKEAESVESEKFNKDDVVYRVQLGAFRNKISTKVFNTSAGVLELKTGENVYRYVTKGYKSIGEAAAVRADLVVQGYSDAFVTAYKNGKRISMSEAGATMDKGYKEDLSEDKTFNSIDKSLLVFKIQLGPLKKPSQEAAMDEKVKDLPNVDKQTTATGNIRYTAGGDFSRLDAAEKLRKELEDKGYTDAFIIATFKNEIISIQEAMELLK